MCTALGVGARGGGHLAQQLVPCLLLLALPATGALGILVLSASVCWGGVFVSWGAAPPPSWAGVQMG